MPCRTDEQDADLAQEEKMKAKEQERRLCEAGSILANLLNNPNFVLTPELRERAEGIVEMHYNHREEELQHELKKLNDKIASLENTCQRIRKMGGEPGHQLIYDIAAKRRLVRSIEEIDRNSPEFWDRERNVF